jgi:parallel beta-helix repeat protein
MRHGPRSTRTGGNYMQSGIRWGGAFGVACALMYASPAAQPADSLCGAAIVADLKLDHDVACTGDGLIAGADGIWIDLNGYTLSGSGVGVGIAITGRRDITISGGTIANFAAGIRVNTATDVDIKHIEFAGNPEGIDFQTGSAGNSVKENVFRNSTVRGIMLRSNATDNDIKNNTFINDRVGILVFGGVDNTLKDNEVSGSTFAGIRINVIATGNVLKDNAVSSSAAGIEFLVTPTGSAQGNELKGNTLSTNACGLKGPTTGNTLKDNIYIDNTTDTCS